MKITATTVLMLHLGGLAFGESEPSPIDHKITVCVASTLTGLIAARAKVLASKMFGGIGLSIDWQQASRSCPAQAILVSISSSTPATLEPGAFAYASPYEGRHIKIFYDRIDNLFEGSMLEIVLAHVLVHEITHILEGVKRHSEQGIMKAKWDSRDYFQMQERPLGFASEDVQLIYLGLAARQKRATLALNTEQHPATTGP
ncbi:MAG: hypothetical protein WA324_19490 [Bryobacteraceae bacterium]